MHYGLVLAGGRSSRMGQDKASMRLAQQTWLQRAQQTLHQTACQQVLTSRNTGQGIRDLFPGCGPLAGIHAALRFVPDHHLVTVIAVDMPFLQVEDIRSLQSLAASEQHSCHYRHHYLPMVLWVDDKLRNYVQSRLQQGRDLSLRAMHKALNSREVNCPSDAELGNFNTPQQWAQAQSNALREDHYGAFSI